MNGRRSTSPAGVVSPGATGVSAEAAVAFVPGNESGPTLVSHPVLDCDPENIPAVAALIAVHRLQLRLVDGASLPVHVLAFDRSRFSVDAFHVAGIGCPPSIARSVIKRKAEFFFGRLAAVLALRSAGFAGTSHPEMPIGPSGEPGWPRGFVGSISHNHRLAAAVAQRSGRWGGIGLDIEHVVGAGAREAVLGLVIDRSELSYLKQLASPSWPLDVLLTAVFSAKESLFKGAFGAVGRYFGFDCARLVSFDVGRMRIKLELTETLGEQFIASQICDVGLEIIDRNTVLTHFVWVDPSGLHRRV